MQQLSPIASQQPLPRSNYYNNYQQDQQQQAQQLFPSIQKMVFYLKQEQLAPALLPFKEEVFTKITTQLKDQEEKLKQYKTTEDDPDTTNWEKNYKSIIYSMEIQKISFILKHYLKIRLEKIQKCSFYYFKNMSTAESLMSKSEVEFLKKYVDLRYKYYEKNVFKHLLKNFRGIGGMQLFLGKPEEKKLLNSNQSLSEVLQPDVNSYVFAKMNRNPNQFRYAMDMRITDVPAQESQIASPNDILFVPYAVAKSLMNRSRKDDLALI